MAKNDLTNLQFVTGCLPPILRIFLGSHVPFPITIYYNITFVLYNNGKAQQKETAKE